MPWLSVLNERAPITKKYIRANDGPFTTKALRKEHMHRTKLLKKYSRERTEENFNACKQQRNTCVNLLREAKYDYYRNINLADLSDNYKFWKTVRPLFSDKVQLNSSIALIEDGKMITKDSEIAEVFNNYFVNITENLDISTAESALLPIKNFLDPIEIAVRKFQRHPSICQIQERNHPCNKFEFKEVTIADIVLQIRKLYSNKASQVKSIPAKILKENFNILCPIIQKLYNFGLSKICFLKN